MQIRFLSILVFLIWSIKIQAQSNLLGSWIPDGLGDTEKVCFSFYIENQFKLEEHGKKFLGSYLLDTTQIPTKLKISYMKNGTEINSTVIISFINKNLMKMRFSLSENNVPIDFVEIEPKDSPFITNTFRRKDDAQQQDTKLISKKSPDKKNCQTIDYYIQNTLKALQNQDTNSYAKLASYDTMLVVFKTLTAGDTSQIPLYNQLRDNPDLFRQIFKQNFVRLTNSIRRDLQTDNWTLKLKEYKIINSEKDNVTDHLSLQVLISANDIEYQLSMYITEYKDCYYLFEPVDYYFTKK